MEKRKEKKRQKRLEKRKKEREAQKNENSQAPEVLPIDSNDPFANFEEAFKVPRASQLQNESFLTVCLRHHRMLDTHFRFVFIRLQHVRNEKKTQ